jgi:Cdc6-like AAA superfamily ATPase
MTSSWWVEKTDASKHKDDEIKDFDTRFTKSLYNRPLAKDGSDRYKNIRYVMSGDYIIHLNQDSNEFVGVSVAKDSFKEYKAGKESRLYVILENYVQLEPPIVWEELASKKKKELEAIKSSHSGLFYARRKKPDRKEYFTLAQGNYLTKAPNELIKVINDYYNEIAHKDLPYYVSSLEGSKTSNSSKFDDIGKNIILYGPVGTGKTYLARKIAYKLAKNEPSGLHELLKGTDVKIDNFNEEFRKLQKSQITFVTLHKSYSYEQFVIGITARTNEENQIEYVVEDGIFKKICKRAEQDQKHNYVLIIDEINRGDISKIFGELITLLEDDKRIGAPNEILVTLPYSNKHDSKEGGDEEKFGVPPNLYVIGTMNTTDRSIALLDLALRRRFRTYEIRPDYEFIKQRIHDALMGNEVANTIMIINNRIAYYKGPDFAIGHAYFKDVGSEPKKEIRDIWYSKILPLLLEYFYDDLKTLKEKVLNNTNFVNIPEENGNTGVNFSLVNQDYLDNSKLNEFYEEFKNIASS